MVMLDDLPPDSYVRLDPYAVKVRNASTTLSPSMLGQAIRRANCHFGHFRLLHEPP